MVISILYLFKYNTNFLCIFLLISAIIKGMSEVEFLKTIKKNLPDGVKKQFGKVKGVKVRFINKN